jgi:hypothetical protein
VLAILDKFEVPTCKNFSGDVSQKSRVKFKRQRVHFGQLMHGV